MAQFRKITKALREPSVTPHEREKNDSMAGPNTTWGNEYYHKNKF